MNVLDRLRREWFPGQRARDPDTAARRLRVHERSDGGTLGIELADTSAPPTGVAPSTLRHLCEIVARRPSDVVALGPLVYPSLPTTEARVQLLAACRASARSHIVAHVPVEDDATHKGRVVFDGPRRVLRALGLPAAEPGDRFTEAGFRHHFFDEEPLVLEATRAGLFPSSRSGARFVLAPIDAAVPGTMEPPPVVDAADAAWRELTRVLRAVAEVEHARRHLPPEACIAAMRSRGAHARERDRVGRARLRRAIGWVDACTPGGANCWRRVLLESALDAGSARRTLVFGLDVGRTGHVAFASEEDRRFDVTFEVPPRA